MRSVEEEGGSGDGSGARYRAGNCSWVPRGGLVGIYYRFGAGRVVGCGVFGGRCRGVRTNLTGPFLLSRECAPYLADRGGSIVNVASTRATMSEPNTFAYSASKGGLLALTHSLAASLAPVRVNCISPGWIDVDGSKLSKEDHSQHWAGRVGRSEDVAELVGRGRLCDRRRVCAGWRDDPQDDLRGLTGFGLSGDDLVGGGAVDEMVFFEGFGAPNRHGRIGSTFRDVLAGGRDFVDGLYQCGEA